MDRSNEDRERNGCIFGTVAEAPAEEDPRYDRSDLAVDRDPNLQPPTTDQPSHRPILEEMVIPTSIVVWFPVFREQEDQPILPYYPR